MPLFFSDFWGIPESKETETETGMCCHEGSHEVSHEVSAKPVCVCAYCGQDMTPQYSQQEKNCDDIISHVQVCNVLSKMISCSVCKKDMAKLTISERRTHVETCEQKQADAFFKP